MIRSEIADRRHLRIGDDDGGVGESHGERGATLDTGWAIADDPVEFCAQFPDHARHAVFGERILVPRLRGRKQRQRVDPLVADQRLRKLRDTLHDIDQVVDDPSLGSHDQVEVSESDVEIDDDDRLAGGRERGAEGGGRGGLADASLAGRHDDDFAHACIS